jgi:RNA polymerase sigma factor (sigma-70 family)
MHETSQNGRWTLVLDALARFERPLVLFATRLLGDSDRARDVVQETFLRLCREPPGSAVEDHLAAWLYTVCRRLALDELRRDGRMAKTGDAGLEAVLLARPGREEDPARRAETLDETERVLGLLGELPAKQREALELRFRHGLRYREIAEVTGQSLGNVGYLIHEGMNTLRARLVAAELRVTRGGAR